MSLLVLTSQLSTGTVPVVLHRGRTSIPGTYLPFTREWRQLTRDGRAVPPLAHQEPDRPWSPVDPDHPELTWNVPVTTYRARCGQLLSWWCAWDQDSPGTYLSTVLARRMLAAGIARPCARCARSDRQEAQRGAG